MMTGDVERVLAMQKFKDYTHQRMDELGVPHSVDWSEHTAAGCRIGGRFDWLAKELWQWRRYAGYCRSCALSGEHNPITFAEFVGRET